MVVATSGRVVWIVVHDCDSCDYYFDRVGAAGDRTGLETIVDES